MGSAADLAAAARAVAGIAQDTPATPAPQTGGGGATDAGGGAPSLSDLLMALKSGQISAATALQLIMQLVGQGQAPQSPDQLAPADEQNPIQAAYLQGGQ